MRVLHFVRHSFPLKVDGYSIRTRALLQLQEQQGHQPVVVTSPDFAAEHGKRVQEQEEVDGIAHFHFTGRPSAVARLTKRVPLVRRYVRHRRGRRYYSHVVEQCAPCDLFHVHMTPEVVGQLNELRRRYRVPLVYEVRGVWEDSLVACGHLHTTSRSYKQAQRQSTLAAAQADWVITISEGLRQEFIMRGIPEGKISVVPNGVHTNAFQPLARDRELAERLGVVGKTVFGYVSSIRELEGIECLIRAMPAIIASVPNSACVIVGDGDDRLRLESIVKTLGLQDRVIFTGRVPHASVGAYYSIIDVFVVPRPNRRVNKLVTPLKPLEAMAMEKALLVSGVGGLTEMVEDGITGLVFEPENSGDLAAKGILLAQDENLRRRLGGQARRFVMCQRDWNVVNRNYGEMIKTILSARQ